MAVVRERPFYLLSAYTAIALAALLWLIMEYLCMTAPWIRRFWPTASLYGSYAKQAKYRKGALPPAIFSSFFSKQVTFSWTPLLFIALLSIWTRNRPFRSKVKAGEFDATEVYAKPSSAWVNFKHQFKLICNYQLPPRGLWGAILDGGFNVVDFLVVALWASLNAVWLYTSFQLVWPTYVATHKRTGKYTNGGLTADYCEGLGYASAWAAVYNMVFLFLGIQRSSFLAYLFNSDFSSLIRYHRWLGHGTLWITLFHGVVFYVGWFSISTEKFRHETFAWQPTGINYLAGSISFFPFGLMLWLTVIPYVRRKFFRIFYATHLIGAAGFVIFLQIHYPQSVWYYAALPLYFLDVTFRLCQWHVTSGMECTFVSADKTFVTIKLKFNKAAKVRADEFVFINAPRLAYFQWHPFSIAAVYPNQDGMTQDVHIHIKAFGSWTHKLIRALAEEGTIPIRVDGPYGSRSAPEFTNYDHILMIGGGIGVTPLLGMLRDIKSCEDSAAAAETKLGSHTAYSGLPQSVHLIWAVRNRDELQLLDQDLLATAGKSGSWLRLSLFYTRENDCYVDTKQEVGGTHLTSKPQHMGHQSPTTSLQPYGFGDFHLALAHLLAFVGAFFGCLIVNAYQYDKMVSGSRLGRGMRIEAYGILLLLGMIVGSMGLPALIIFPLQHLRYKRHLKTCKEAHAAQYTNGTTNGHAVLTEAQVKSFLPDNVNKPGALDLEAGKAASVTFGRPNIKKIIAEEVAGLPSSEHVGVIVSGPSSLVMDARHATHKASKIAAKAGLKGLPELSFSNHSFDF